MKTLAIDLDGVIHDQKNPLPGKRMGAPIEGAKDALTLLKLQGNKIIIHTVKANTEHGRCAVIDWLNFYQIPCDGVVGKPQADLYVDDKAIRHILWEKTLEEIRNSP
jgi:hypothetical protein